MAQILAAWDEAAREAREPTVRLRVEDIDAVLAWARDGRRRQRYAVRRALDTAIRGVRAMIPESNTKKSYLSSCCRHQLAAVLHELKALSAPCERS